MSDPRRIAIVGATGYTGRLAVAALRPGDPVVLVGRDADRLAALGPFQQATGDLSDPDFCAALAESVDGVLSFAGPFGLLGRPLLEACVAAGTDWVDVCGELDFVAHSTAHLAERAESTGARLVHACATESLPALCLVDELVGDTDHVQAVDVEYRFELPLASPGTRLTAQLDGLAPPRAWIDGALRTPESLERPAWTEGLVARLTSYPEAALVPHRVRCDRVSAWVALRSWATGAGGPTKTVDEVVAAHRERVRPGPPPQLRAKTVVHVTARVATGDGVQQASCAVHDSYAFSARAALAVARALDESVPPGLVLAPQIVGRLGGLTALLASGPAASGRGPSPAPHPPE